jgi:aminoglycoside 2'-N-acetyltransferase I
VDVARTRREDARVPELKVAHTSALDPATLDAARRMLVEAFEDSFEPADWEHALGGMHALVIEDGAVIAHASVVQRRMLHGGRALRAGYVEGVGVRADRRREGHGGAMMGALEEVIRRAYQLGALGATDAGAALYTSRGWRRWEGRSCALTPDGIRRTPEEDGSIYVLEAGVALDFGGELTADWRDGGPW